MKFHVQEDPKYTSRGENERLAGVLRRIGHEEVGLESAEMLITLMFMGIDSPVSCKVWFGSDTMINPKSVFLFKNVNKLLDWFAPGWSGDQEED